MTEHRTFQPSMDEATSKILNENQDKPTDQPIIRRAQFAIEGGQEGGVTYGNPIHEMLTISALINSQYQLKNTITAFQLRHYPLMHPDVNDFIRGVVWNDDPEDALFNDNPKNNLDYGLGLDWVSKFKFGGFTKPELIHRSHFADLQWLHAMGSRDGEQPAETKKNLLQWIETMYKIATGVLDPNTPIAKTLVKDWFDDPAHYTTIGELLTRRRSSPAIIPNRALGSCFHVIQDSYSVAHCHRELLSNNNMPPGSSKVARYGAVLNFHTYDGQNEDQHSAYDHGSDYVGMVREDQLDTWNSLVGCRDAVDQCIVLANYWYNHTAWDEVFHWLDSTVFAISPNATPSDHTIE